MRIIAGSARSRTILTPEGRDTRPTLDRVRESLFNILQPYTLGAKVLDLFAGSGALSLEALSRGADFALLVDAARDANRIENQNVQALGFQSKSEVVLMDWQQAIIKKAPQYAPFDLVFLDPPYKMVDLVQVGEALLPLLHQGSVVVIEHDEKTEPLFHERYELRDKRRYGKAGILFYRLKEE